LEFKANCVISQAFVEMQMLCYYPEDWVRSHTLLLTMPKTTDTTITEVSVHNQVRPSVVATTVVPNEDMKRYNGYGGAEQRQRSQDPELFYFPMIAGMPGDQLRVNITYFQPLMFEKGRYVLRLPTKMPQACIPPGVPHLNTLINVEVSISIADSQAVDMKCPSHPVTTLAAIPGSLKFKLDENTQWPNRDFVCGYGMWRDGITATMLVQPPQPGAMEGQGTFCLTISPPGPEHSSVVFRRSVVFLFDRSGSMVGEPLQAAKAALTKGLELLAPGDSFAVVAFDHDQIWWPEYEGTWIQAEKHLVQASPENIRACSDWINRLQARGTTDIMTPLQMALRALRNSAGSVPFAFVITDGCVENERDICASITSSVVNPIPEAGLPLPSSSGIAPRIFTFGIGPYCNHYFLKQLATQGRGMFDVAFTNYHVQVQMERMLLAAALPLLVSLELDVPGVQYDLFPRPIPDVFCGQPLLVSGKYEGKWPDAVVVRGVLPTGAGWVQECPSLPAGQLPLYKVFVKAHLDWLTADAWLHNNPPHMVDKIISISMNNSVPSAYTSMVSFETTNDKWQQMQATPLQDRRKMIARWAIGGAAGVGVVGGVAAALAFGDLLASVANSPITDAMGGGADLMDGLMGMGDLCSCCDGCADCADGCAACAVC